MHILKILPFIAVFLFSPVSALSSDWSKQLAGLDGVASWCIDHADGKYGKKLCGKILDYMTEQLEQSEIPVEAFGYFRVDAPPTQKPKDIKNPLNLVLIIRGTSGGTVAIQLRWRASVSYQAAVEKGSDGEGRAGELVLHEKSFTGSGPNKRLQTAIGDAMVKHIGETFKEMLPAWDKT